MLQSDSILDSISFSKTVSPYGGDFEAPLTITNTAKNISKLLIEEIPKRERFDGRQGNYKPDLWILIALLIGYLSIAFIRAVYRKRFTMLFQTLMNWKLSKQIIRYEKVYTHPVNIIMTLNFLLCFPLFFAIVRSEYIEPSESIAFSFLLIFIPVLVYSVLKVGFHQFTGWLWNEKKSIGEYLFQTNLFNKYIGLGFLLLSTVLIYSPLNINIIVYFAFGIIGLSSIFQLIRGVIIGLESGLKLYFIILYLCTLEILPWLAIGKWISTSL